mmetsp:Transcript_1855/g.2396  ORF Transcript_1855/g.2396 Transcript_1855/m.2396 type:complete len:212 (+) Transcript_1855:196-831(+)
MAKDKNGVLFIAYQSSVLQYHPKERKGKLIAESKGNTKNDFRDISGIAVTQSGAIYVCDRKNHCIGKICDGTISVIAGLPGVFTLPPNFSGGFREGSLAESRFHSPHSIMATEGETLLVTDECGIRRLRIAEDYVDLIYRQPESWSVARPINGNLILAAQGCVFLLRVSWRIVRLLWIANKKEDLRNCPLASLNRDLIKEVIAKLTECVSC